MAIWRPYMQLSLDTLKAKFRDSPADRILLEEVQQELAFRTTPGAKRLEREVQALLARAETDSAEKPFGRVPAAASNVASPAPPAGVPSSNLEVRYFALRATFTAEAEILSRWGMTSLATQPVRDTVFRYWHEALLNLDAQHPLGLSREDLERDIEALKNEKRES